MAVGGACGVKRPPRATRGQGRFRTLVPALQPTQRKGIGTPSKQAQHRLCQSAPPPRFFPCTTCQQYITKDRIKASCGIVALFFRVRLSRRVGVVPAPWFALARVSSVHLSPACVPPFLPLSLALTVPVSILRQTSNASRQQRAERGERSECSCMFANGVLACKVLQFLPLFPPPSPPSILQLASALPLPLHSHPSRLFVSSRDRRRTNREVQHGPSAPIRPADSASDSPFLPPLARKACCLSLLPLFSPLAQPPCESERALASTASTRERSTLFCAGRAESAPTITHAGFPRPSPSVPLSTRGAALPRCAAHSAMRRCGCSGCYCCLCSQLRPAPTPPATRGPARPSSSSPSAAACAS